MTAPLTPQQAQEILNVSRETLDKFEAYLGLLAKWNKTYNLVGDTTLQDPWRRHVVDCVQVSRQLDNTNAVILDIGTGAGLPGLLLAILGYKNVHLVESNQKKGLFLQQVMRELGLTAHLHVQRLENISPFPCEAITARACASVYKLLKMSQSFCTPKTQHVYLKGKEAQEEVKEAKRHGWQFKEHYATSLAASEGKILILTDVKPEKI